MLVHCQFHCRRHGLLAVAGRDRESDPSTLRDVHLVKRHVAASVQCCVRISFLSADVACPYEREGMVHHTFVRIRVGRAAVHELLLLRRHMITVARGPRAFDSAGGSSKSRTLRGTEVNPPCVVLSEASFFTAVSTPCVTQSTDEAKPVRSQTWHIATRTQRQTRPVYPAANSSCMKSVWSFSSNVSSRLLALVAPLITTLWMYAAANTAAVIRDAIVAETWAVLFSGSRELCAAWRFARS